MDLCHSRELNDIYIWLKKPAGINFGCRLFIRFSYSIHYAINYSFLISTLDFQRRIFTRLTIPNCHKNCKNVGTIFDDFNWVEQFTVIKKGTKAWNNVLNDEIVGLRQVPDNERFYL